MEEAKPISQIISPNIAVFAIKLKGGNPLVD